MDALSLLHLPPQHLTDGVGTLRDIWTDSGAGQNLRWLLRLVELRSSHGKTDAPAGTEQLIVGISGPQVRIGAGRGVPLRRDRALGHGTSLIEMHRPVERSAGASRLLMLAYDPRVVSARATFDDVDGDAVVAPGTEALVVLRGHVEHAGKRLDSNSVSIFRAPVAEAIHARDARVLTLQFSDAYPSSAEERLAVAG